MHYNITGRWIMKSVWCMDIYATTDILPPTIRNPLSSICQCHRCPSLAWQAKGSPLTLYRSILSSPSALPTPCNLLCWSWGGWIIFIGGYSTQSHESIGEYWVHCVLKTFSQMLLSHSYFGDQTLLRGSKDFICIVYWYFYDPLYASNMHNIVYVRQCGDAWTCVWNKYGI